MSGVTAQENPIVMTSQPQSLVCKRCLMWFTGGCDVWLVSLCVRLHCGVV